MALLLAMTAASPAPAQIVGGGLAGLPGMGLPRADLPGALPRGGTGAAGSGLRGPTAILTPVEQMAAKLASAPLTDVRRLTAERLLKDNPRVLEADENGRPVVRGEVLATGLSSDALARLRRSGFTARPSDDLRQLGLDAVVIRIPRGQSALEAVNRLRALDPNGQYDLNHLYQQSGFATGAERGGGPPAAADGRGLRIGLVDGGVDPGTPSLRRVHLVQRAFGPGGGGVSAHGTATASLIVGDAREFRGAAPGATLYVADVYGPTPAGGSAESVARALAWLEQAGTPVVSISLVGPPNLLLRAAVEAMIARGHLIVAAVGNDGPAAPPLYPAAYAGVVSVTGVDARRQVLPEAGRGSHVDFAAPGADMAAAGVGGGYASVRGTSFAAPIVAARLAGVAASSARSQALEALGRTAVDLGAPGPDPVYGRGLVGEDVRTDPGRVGASKSPR